jgi:hypothetical protein
MLISESIMEEVYGPEHTQVHDEQYQRDRATYRALSGQLNRPLGDDPAKRAALIVISRFLFRKRNAVSIGKSARAYCSEQQRSLPRRAPKFFPDVRSFLRATGVDCGAAQFDTAVLAKLDVYTQAMFSLRDTTYFDLKNLFFRPQNCSTPLDFVLHGIFYARAAKNVRMVLRAAVALLAIIAFILLAVFARGRR